MLEIDVFFGLDKEDPSLPPVLVRPDPVAAHSGDDVIWHFHSLDDGIHSVLVDFTDVNDDYFECRDKPARSKKCHTHLHGGGAPTSKGKHGHLLGTTPSLATHGAKASKYTITAYDGDPDGSGKPIEEYTLDPIVVTCDP